MSTRTPSIHDRIVAIIAEQAMLDPAQITPESSTADLAIDSLGLVQSILAIEEAFDITIPYNVNEPEKSDFDISSVGRVIEAVERLIAQRA
ncbi:acyl carrier protein [Paracoccus alkenifer]|uniref:Acyl carrier protein n=1 Tax=Paracoccus alkenifer TaxID=65735 RepID=A0A1H6K6K3_9RHOB|nr:acyl carrier protein [Paracoccus alkenifer]SEH67074.1 acyl carrier protein [Paracoccus alkenifer]